MTAQMGVGTPSLGRPHAVRHIILGAGCAGLSLCYYLLQEGVTDEILILDRKPAFTDDRTWCFWDVEPTAFSDLKTHCWHRWQVFDMDGHRVDQACRSIGYVRIRGADFYAFVLDVLARHPNVTLRLGERVDEIVEEEGRVCVRTDKAEYTGACVFDSLGLGAQDQASGSFPPITLCQHFVGQTIRTASPRFDPSCCTLMDFRAEQQDGLHFFYVLPLSPVEALVENTYIGSRRFPSERYRHEIDTYVHRVLDLDHYVPVHEEAGAILMTTHPFPLRRGKRVLMIGTAGGGSKPSSGYTFLRIQRHCRNLARAVAQGEAAIPARIASRRSDFYDAVFLAAIQQCPEQFPRYLCRLFEAVPPETLTRFLSETSTWHDDRKVIGGLPPLQFLRAALTSAPQWLRMIANRAGETSGGCAPC